VTRRLIPLLLCAAVAVAVVPAAPATAARNFTFFGSGYGHGIGMSQWGANGLAKMGWSEQRIIEHFYRGTEVARTDSLPRNIRSRSSPA
jgi:stage II sporulation protein D